MQDVPPPIHTKGSTMNKAFGKFYAKTFTGSMYGAGASVFAVWGYCVANAVPPGGTVELNTKFIAPMLGMSEQDVATAIEYLCAPDPASRTATDEGRRLRKTGSFEYELVNFDAHRNGNDADARREYWKDRQRAHRESVSNDVNPSVNDSPGQSHKQKQKQKQKQRSEAYKDVGKNGSAVASPTSQSDSEWIAELKSNPAYQGIEVEREHSKMLEWCKVQHKQPTRRRFVNWLNRCDKPMAGKPATQAEAETKRVYTLRDFA
jgi:hypothetical protein